MSLESLLLLAFFVLLPLIQQLLDWQKRAGQAPPPPVESPAGATPQPKQEGQSPPAPPAPDTNVPPPPRQPKPQLQPPPAPLPPAPVSRPPAAAPPSVPVRTLARERTPARAARSSVTAARPRPRGTAAEELRHPIGLRRSIVQMTILGPCRATDPYGWPTG